MMMATINRPRNAFQPAGWEATPFLVHVSTLLALLALAVCSLNPLPAHAEETEEKPGLVTSLRKVDQSLQQITDDPTGWFGKKVRGLFGDSETAVRNAKKAGEHAYGIQERGMQAIRDMDRTGDPAYSDEFYDWLASDKLPDLSDDLFDWVAPDSLKKMKKQWDEAMTKADHLSGRIDDLLETLEDYDPFGDAAENNTANGSTPDYPEPAREPDSFEATVPSWEPDEHEYAYDKEETSFETDNDENLLADDGAWPDATTAGNDGSSANDNEFADEGSDRQFDEERAVDYTHEPPDDSGLSQDCLVIKNAKCFVLDSEDPDDSGHDALVEYGDRSYTASPYATGSLFGGSSTSPFGSQPMGAGSAFENGLGRSYTGGGLMAAPEPGRFGGDDTVSPLCGSELTAAGNALMQCTRSMSGDGICLTYRHVARCVEAYVTRVQSTSCPAGIIHSNIAGMRSFSDQLIRGSQEYCAR